MASNYGNSGMTLTCNKSRDLCWAYEDYLPSDWVKCKSRTNTGGASEVVGVAHVAVAAEGTHIVNTLAIPTQVGQDPTLINICGNKESHLV